MGSIKDSLGGLMHGPLLLGIAVILGRASAELAWVTDAGTCAARFPAGRMTLRVHLQEPAPLEGGRLEAA